MNQYEGMFIFPKALTEEGYEEALGAVRDDIEKCSGKVTSMTRLGKRPFARPMGKQDAGYYAVINFSIPGTAIAPLRARLKLNEKVLRNQLIRALPPRRSKAKAEAGAAKKEG